MAGYDVIVVGAGPAGSAAALVLARQGCSVLLLDRGDVPGSKNASGARLYCHSLEKLLPEDFSEAPMERRVTRETLSFMTPESCFNLDFQSSKLTRYPSCTLLRSRFDSWLAAKAEEAGCDLATPVRVDALLYDEQGKICGVQAGDDALTADIVLLAEGVNGLLAQQAGLKKELKPDQVAVGIKEVRSLSEGMINDRFGLEHDEGCARLFAGSPSQGHTGGGFLYTNKESISIGLVVSLEQRSAMETSLPEMLEAFKHHPSVRPLIAGSRLEEYSAHLIPEGGFHMVPELAGDHVLLAGDAAGFCLNLGYTVRGMDFAITSGMLAAETVLEAKANNDFSASGLKGYRTRLAESFVLKDLETHRKAPAFIAETTRMYGVYPEMLEKIMLDVFHVDGDGSHHMIQRLLPHLREAGLLNILKDGLSALRAL